MGQNGKLVETDRRRAAQAMVSTVLTLTTYGSSRAAALRRSGTPPAALIVPSGPGGVSDKVARAWASTCRRLTGEALLVHNRPGAGGALALSAMRGVPADGSVLFLGSVATQVVLPLAPRRAASPPPALLPLAKLASTVGVLVSSAGFPPRTLEELVHLSRHHARRVSYASAGIGSLGHLAMEVLSMHAGMELAHVPYKSGPESVPDLLAGRVQLNLLNMGAALPLVRDGRLRALAVSGRHRLPAMAEVPTLHELGYEDADIENWQGLFMPAGGDGSCSRRLTAAAGAVLADAAYRQLLQADLIVPAEPQTPAAFARAIDDQRQWAARLVRERGIRLF